MSIIVFGLIFSTASVSDLAFADKPNNGDQKNAKTDREIERADAKTDREIERADAKTDREIERADAKTDRDTERADAKTDRDTERADAKTDRKNVEEFNGDVVITSSSTTTICHIPPGNKENAHEISIGVPAVNAHLAHGDTEGSCPSSSGEFKDGVLVTSSSTTTICHIPPGNKENAHEISIGVPAVNAHLAHGDTEGSCPSSSGEFNDNADENGSNAAENNENLIENLTRQIANLEKSLQNFLDQFLI